MTITRDITLGNIITADDAVTAIRVQGAWVRIDQIISVDADGPYTDHVPQSRDYWMVTMRFADGSPATELTMSHHETKDAAVAAADAIALRLWG